MRGGFRAQEKYGGWCARSDVVKRRKVFVLLAHAIKTIPTRSVVNHRVEKNQCIGYTAIRKVIIQMIVIVD